ncbi:cobalamin B12-binding domain-containing protein [Aquisediminimonas profunda]|uniref:cobalamin B12-binding domain-containing protein n=1 Tax=Aquisediminimonas profunda TaxID=1550733 RepID=UPI001C630386|nr:cobalamin-dependent protein [Aquisediminimonas profunda]
MASTWGMEQNFRYSSFRDLSGGGADRSPDMLARLIEAEIIPRLLLAHSDETLEQDAVAADVAPCVEPGEAEAFARLALNNEAHVLMRHVDAALARGLPVEAVLVEILAPAARDMGEKWENDEVDFIDVTMGLWRLQEVVYELSARACGAAENRGGDRRALLCVMPGEQHTFGTIVIEECFRRRGWDTRCITNATQPQLLMLAGERWFEIIGLTVSCDHHIDDLTRIVGLLRSSSRNPHVGIMVGGRIFNNNADLATRIGADATAQNALLAVDRAEALVASMASRPAIEV